MESVGTRTASPATTVATAPVTLSVVVATISYSPSLQSEFPVGAPATPKVKRDAVQLSPSMVDKSSWAFATTCFLRQDGLLFVPRPLTVTVTSLVPSPFTSMQTIFATLPQPGTITEAAAVGSVCVIFELLTTISIASCAAATASFRAWKLPTTSKLLLPRLKVTSANKVINTSMTKPMKSAMPRCWFRIVVMARSSFPRDYSIGPQPDRRDACMPDQR